MDRDKDSSPAVHGEEEDGGGETGQKVQVLHVMSLFIQLCFYFTMWIIQNQNEFTLQTSTEVRLPPGSTVNLHIFVRFILM